ncbi:Transcription factor Tfb4 family protein [Theileria parva strain Muguga]|uniref:Uncharacterized protein n=1 Tax=Theileria parva TaxID=5875 RepID=Q4N1C3_THEPA|nr:Transcription factor Tfb4 family protein [Theileria parva strain Muguga]EAN32177.1 Transcription factor Tfb4 family protein [Theileria parva strain Muguga]|eukprot:XP_764460.1 hypothetical protein [Theileria parva strain Muguga]
MMKSMSMEEISDLLVSESVSDSVPSEDALVLILDLSPGRWSSGVPLRPEEPEKRIHLHNFFTVLANFLKLFGYMSVRNKTLIITANNHSTRILYEGFVYNDWTDSCFGVNSSVYTNSQHCDTDRTGEKVDKTLGVMWNKMIDFISEGLTYPDADTQLTSAIATGFLYLNRIRMRNEGYGRKIIIFDVSTSENYKSQYIGLMNIAYSALAQNITINTFALGQPSRILEQLSSITRGKYLLVSKVLNFDLNFSHINQYLSQLITFWYLPSEGMSELLSTNLSFDFGNVGICYCHYKSVDVSYLCPCCFAVYCSEIDDKGKYRIICMVCGSRLTRKLIKQKLATEADFSKL